MRLLLLVAACGVLAGVDPSTRHLLQQVGLALPAAPTAPPAPRPYGQGDHMALGAGYTQTGSDFQIVHPQSRFHAADPFAFVVHLDGPIGTTHPEFILEQLHASGAATVVATTRITVSTPSDTEFADTLARTDSMMGSSPVGTYTLEIAAGTAMVASATFSYLG